MRTSAVLLSLAIFCLPLTAVAQPAEEDTAAAETDEERKARARVAYEAGKTHYAVGEFDDALVQFAEAYKLRPAPLLLFNMGQCHRQLKNHERAAFFLDGYLRDADADDSNREVAANLLLEEQAAADTESAAKEQARIEADAQLASEAAARETLEAAAREADEEAAVASPMSSPDASPSAGSEAPIWTQWWLWTGVAAAVVVASAAVGTTAAVIALSGDGQPDSSLEPVDLR